jgi:serine/threonine-protein kinase
MNDYFKMFLIALVTSVASQLLLTPYILRLQGFGGVPEGPINTARIEQGSDAAASAEEKLSAPNLEAMTVEAARERWRAKGLVVIEDGERVVSDAEPGTIVQQSPAAGDVLASGKEIRVIVAKAAKEANVPDVMGQKADDARSSLVAAGFEVPEPLQEASDQAMGTVIKQVPNPGAQAKTGSIIRLTVAKPAAIEVPKVSGMYLANAKRAVAEAGLTVGKVRRVEHPEKGENYVLRQNPAPGDKVPPATEVELVVVAPN